MYILLNTSELAKKQKNNKILEKLLPDTGYVAMAKNNPQGKEGNAQIERLYSSIFEVITQF